VNVTAFRPDVQGRRAIAVTSISLYDAGLPIPGGFVGVDIFFVISGFVITALLLRELERNKRVAFLNFYWHRIEGLAAALAVMTQVAVFAFFLLLSLSGSQQLVAQTGIGAILSGTNVVIARSTGNYFDPSADANPPLHT